jgi:hypothetical protein
MPSPLPALKVYVEHRHIAHLRTEAARRHMSVSLVVRELIDRDISRKERAKRRAVNAG